jgi:hypothetical protein
MTVGKTLRTELSVFERHKRDWLKSNPGKFVVIAEKTVAGFYSDYESAFQAGLKKFGVDAAFLIKQVWEEQPVYLIH